MEQEKSSGITLLRRLTLKSRLNFGQYALLTVQEIINLLDHQYLIWAYYCLENIDFNEEVKEYLRITYEREIPKPGKNENCLREFRGVCLYEIIERDKTYDPSNPDRFFAKHNNQAIRKAKIVNNCIRQNKEKSKIRNRDRNQKR